MAIKGKKKQQKRGSQARRRPAVAPRASASRQVHVPWYRTPGGRVGAAVLVVVLIAAFGGLIAAVVNKSGGDSTSAASETELREYTQQVEALLSQITPHVAAMGAFSPDPDEKELKQLEDEALSWKNGLRLAQNGSGELLKPPSDLAGLNTLFVASIQEYLSAVDAYELAVATQDDDVRRGVIDLAIDSRNRATSIWTTGIQILDQARDDVGLGASGIQNPLLGTPQG
jgi:hypothetical protein